MSRMPIVQRCVDVSNSYHVHASDALSRSHLLQLKSESFLLLYPAASYIKLLALVRDLAH